MNQSYPENWPWYFTATIYEWKHVLADDDCKTIIIDSLSRPLSVELSTPAVFDQKPDYIHYNPVKAHRPLRAGLCINPEDYYYSSASFYHNGTDNFGMLTHYSGN